MMGELLDVDFYVGVGLDGLFLSYFGDKLFIDVVGRVLHSYV